MLTYPFIALTFDLYYVMSHEDHIGKTVVGKSRDIVAGKFNHEHKQGNAFVTGSLN